MALMFQITSIVTSFLFLAAAIIGFSKTAIASTSEQTETYQSEYQSEYRESSVFFADVVGFGSSNSLTRYTDNLVGRQQRSFRNLASWQHSGQNSASLEAKACRALYDDLFRDGVMRVTLVFGYQDSLKQTLDGRFYQQTFDTLIRRCPSSAHAVCGYRLIAGSRSGYRATLSKAVLLRGANGQSKLAEIRLQMARSALSSRDESNLEYGKPSSEQRALTRQAEDIFFGGISGFNADGSPQEKCEICAYYGHARDGGGPDFGPVPYEWRTARGKPNYDIYQARRPGYRKLLASLERAKNDPPKLVSLQACYSYRHFWSRKTCVKNEPGCKGLSLSDYASKTGFILSHQLSWPENFGQTIGIFLDTVLGLKCRSAWQTNSSRLLYLPGNNENYGIFGQYF